MKMLLSVGANLVSRPYLGGSRFVQTHRQIPASMMAVMQPILKVGTAVEPAHLINAITQAVTLIKTQSGVALSKKEATSLSSSLDLVVIPLLNTLTDQVSKDPNIRIDPLRHVAQTLDELIPTALPRFQSQLLQCAAKTKRILVAGGHTFSITTATDVTALRMMESAHRIVSAHTQRSDDRYVQLWKQANRTLNASPVLEFQSNYKALTSRIDGFFAFLKLMRPETPLSETPGWDMLTSITPETLSAAVTHATNFAISKYPVMALSVGSFVLGLAHNRFHAMHRLDLSCLSRWVWLSPLNKQMTRLAHQFRDSDTGRHVEIIRQLHLGHQHPIYIEEIVKYVARHITATNQPRLVPVFADVLDHLPRVAYDAQPVSLDSLRNQARGTATSPYWIGITELGRMMLTGPSSEIRTEAAVALSMIETNTPNSRDRAFARLISEAPLLGRYMSRQLDTVTYYSAPDSAPLTVAKTLYDEHRYLETVNHLTPLLASSDLGLAVSARMMMAQAHLIRSQIEESFCHSVPSALWRTPMGTLVGGSDHDRLSLVDMTQHFLATITHCEVPDTPISHHDAAIIKRLLLLITEGRFGKVASSLRFHHDTLNTWVREADSAPIGDLLTAFAQTIRSACYASLETGPNRMVVAGEAPERVHVNRAMQHYVAAARSLSAVSSVAPMALAITINALYTASEMVRMGSAVDPVEDVLSPFFASEWTQCLPEPYRHVICQLCAVRRISDGMESLDKTFQNDWRSMTDTAYTTPYLETKKALMAASQKLVYRMSHLPMACPETPIFILNVSRYALQFLDPGIAIAGSQILLDMPTSDALHRQAMLQWTMGVLLSGHMDDLVSRCRTEPSFQAHVRRMVNVVIDDITDYVMTRIQSTASISGIHSGPLLAYHAVRQNPTLLTLESFVSESQLPIGAAQWQTLAIAHLLDDLVTHGKPNRSRIDHCLSQLSDRHAHSAHVAVLKSATAILDDTLGIQPQQMRAQNLDALHRANTVMGLAKQFKCRTATVTFLAYAHPFPLTPRDLSFASSFALSALELQPYPYPQVVRFSTAYITVMDQVFRLAARYPEDRDYLPLKKSLIRGGMHLLALLEQCPEAQARRLKADLCQCLGLGDSGGAVSGISFSILEAEDPFLIARQAVQQYPLSIENKIDLMRAALQAFHKNRMTSTVTGYVFLIENTLTVANKALADIVHRHPDFSPERVAAIRRAIEALPQYSLAEPACDHQIWEIGRMFDQLAADYVGQWGRG